MRNKLCESAHRITLSLNRFKPLTFTLPHAILPESLKASLKRQEGIVEVVVKKALDNFWPDDFSPSEQQLSSSYPWNAEDLKPWTEKKLLARHIGSQFRPENHNVTGRETNSRYFLLQVSSFINTLFDHAVEEPNNGDLYYEVYHSTAQSKEDHERMINLMTDQEENPQLVPDWFIRVHLPVRKSPRGTPILLMSVGDRHLYDRLNSLFDSGEEWHFCNCSILDEDQDDHQHSAEASSTSRNVYLTTDGVAQFFRYILRLNSMKIQPTAWQRENLGLSSMKSPWLATFVQPIYRQLSSYEMILHHWFYPPPANIRWCARCRMRPDHLKLCARCKGICYCSAECQRADWPTHKQSCRKTQANFNSTQSSANKQ